ncbi:unnamed protein product [Peronospora belbahrii]|uniref:Uncharacterized protein n=1 Tax=Peronospora belbahrii TaxID=622444 RepID=A0AAU9KZE5_9STRA|nr:unnamed protein product [Peronospora belbahrii]
MLLEIHHDGSDRLRATLNKEYGPHRIISQHIEVPDLQHHCISLLQYYRSNCELNTMESSLTASKVVMFGNLVKASSCVVFLILFILVAIVITRIPRTLLRCWTEDCSLRALLHSDSSFTRYSKCDTTAAFFIV